MQERNIMRKSSKLKNAIAQFRTACINELHPLGVEVESASIVNSQYKLYCRFMESNITVTGQSMSEIIKKVKRLLQ